MQEEMEPCPIRSKRISSTKSTKTNIYFNKIIIRCSVIRLHSRMNSLTKLTEQRPLKIIILGRIMISLTIITVSKVLQPKRIKVMEIRKRTKRKWARIWFNCLSQYLSQCSVSLIAIFICKSFCKTSCKRKRKIKTSTTMPKLRMWIQAVLHHSSICHLLNSKVTIFKRIFRHSTNKCKRCKRNTNYSNKPEQCSECTWLRTSWQSSRSNSAFISSNTCSSTTRSSCPTPWLTLVSPRTPHWRVSTRGGMQSVPTSWESKLWGIDGIIARTRTPRSFQESNRHNIYMIQSRPVKSSWFKKANYLSISNKRTLDPMTKRYW